jgi:hypothetical protein
MTSPPPSHKDFPWANFIATKYLCSSPLTCHSEGAERPKNLINTQKYQILRSAPDDKMAWRRDLNST